MSTRLITLLYLTVLILVLGERVQSQSIFAPKAVQQLTAIKAANQKLMERQLELFNKLDEVQKQAAQVKFLSKRG